jgi:hypothetical protein
MSRRSLAPHVGCRATLGFAAQADSGFRALDPEPEQGSHALFLNLARRRRRGKRDVVDAPFPLLRPAYPRVGLGLPPGPPRGSGRGEKVAM